MPWLNPLLIAYAILSIGLGLDGYIAKGSVISLVAGGLAGLLMIGTVLLAKTKPRVGRIASLVVALAMLGNFLPKFLKSHDWMPAGIMSIASIVVIVALLAGHLMAQKPNPTAE